MLPHGTACKAGAFLVEPHPLSDDRSACCSGAALGLGGFGDLPVLAGTRHNCGTKWCGQPVTLRHLNDGVVTS